MASDETTTTFTPEDYQAVYRVDALPTGVPSRSAALDARFGKKETALSAHQRQLHHRFKSLALDCAFVERVRAALPQWPVVGNLRAGAWYVRSTDALARFKSVDGHAATWTFVPSRANLDFAAKAMASNGAILVDASRAGKASPDSFNRTVPLWCCVMNLVFASQGPRGANDIVLPPWAMRGEAERFTAAQLDQWADAVRALVRASQLSFNPRGRRFKPFFVLNDCAPYGYSPFAALDDAIADDVVPIVCVSASAAVTAAEHREFFSFAYVPGAGDDEENWAQALTPALFSEHCQRLCACDDNAAAEAVVAELVASQAARSVANRIGIGRFIVQWGGTPDGHFADFQWLRADGKAAGERERWHAQAFPELRAVLDAAGASLVLALGDESSGLAAALFIACRQFGDDDNNVELARPATRLGKPALQRKLAQVMARAPPGAHLHRRLCKLVFVEFGDWSAPECELCIL